VTRGTLALLAVFVPVVYLAVPANSAVNGNAALRLTFTSTQPGASTGIRVDVRLGDPVGSDNKPRQLTAARIQLPTGTVIKTSARPQCTAPDPVLQTAGALGCPADSRVGSGSVTAVTGFGAPVDPLVGDDAVFNGEDELIEIVTPPGAPAPAAGVDRLTISGSTLTAHPPTVPGGPPDYTTNIKRIRFVVPAHGSGADAYITTPPRCPRSGHWRTVATFTFAGGMTDRVTADTPCTG
jgi:hypothetical protein